MIKLLGYLVLACALLFARQAHADTIEQAWAKCQNELVNIQSMGGVSNVQPCIEIHLSGTNGQPLGTFHTEFYQYGGGPNQATFWSYYSACAAGTAFDRQSGTCKQDCNSAAPMTGGWALNNGNVCDGACVFSPTSNAVAASKTIDGVTYFSTSGWVANGEGYTPTTCSVSTVATPPLDTDGDGYSDGHDSFPTNPNEHQDSDGDGVGDSGDSAPNDPKNGDDGSKPPTCDADPATSLPDCGPGNETDNHSSGGGDCNTPPVSSGDGITAQIAFQTWATRCEAFAQKNLMKATNDKLDAMKAVQAAQSTAAKQDDLKAEVALSRAQLAQLAAAQLAEQVNTTAAVNAHKAQQATEVAATNGKIDALNAKLGTEQQATRDRIDALNTKMASEVDDTNAKLAALNALSMDALTGDQQRSNKIDTTNSNLAAIKDAQQTQADVAHMDAGDIKGKMDALKAAIDAGTAKLGGTLNTHCDNCNASTGTDNSLLQGILDKLGTVGEDIASNIPGIGQLVGSLNSIKDWLFTPAAGVPEDTTGLDADPASVSRTVDIGADGLDQTGFGWSRTCPAPISVAVFSQTIELKTDILCNWLAIGGWFVLLITGWKCISMVVNA